MKVVKATGLVPVHTATDKRVFGVYPAQAAKGIQDGTLIAVEIPDDIETFEVALAPAPASAPAETPEDAEEVKIPDDWEALHWATQVVIAKGILKAELPDLSDKKPADVARDIIRDELARRASGAKSPDGSGDTTQTTGNAGENA
ncbi:hypothetical protein ShzoTeo12_11340 [Shinella zoogloeoides]|nr:hypothetical protein ShzoTeo12_11340 [Shinella zoogloeoides]